MDDPKQSLEEQAKALIKEKYRSDQSGSSQSVYGTPIRPNGKSTKKISYRLLLVVVVGLVAVAVILTSINSFETIPNEDETSPQEAPAQETPYAQSPQSTLKVGKLYLSLIEAAKQRDATAVPALLDAGAEVDQRDPLGRNALIWSAMQGDTVTGEVLLQAGADPNLEDNDGYTALWMAAEEGYAAMVKSLINAGADVTSWQSSTSSSTRRNKKPVA